MSLCDQACDILRSTHDGNDLAPRDLALLERAVNGYLIAGETQIFLELHRRVMSGEYQHPWFHGFEHLTIDHEGFVLWKGQAVEHYSPRWASSEQAKIQATELVRRCRILDSYGIVPTTMTTVWHWGEPSHPLASTDYLSSLSA